MSDQPSAKTAETREKLCAEHVKSQNLSFRVVYSCAWMSSKEIDAIKRAFLAGWDARDEEVKEFKRLHLEQLARQNHEAGENHAFRKYQPRIDALEAENKRLREAMEKSIARADDYGDSYCSQPIRQALALKSKERQALTAVETKE